MVMFHPRHIRIFSNLTGKKEEKTCKVLSFDEKENLFKKVRQFCNLYVYISSRARVLKKTRKRS